MESTTKERILDKALVSFAVNGYKGTNLRDLAASLGLSKSALYRHYASKDDIWNAVIDRIDAYYAEHFGSPDNLPPMPHTAGELYDVTMQMLRFTMHDPKIILARQLLTTSQYSDERARSLATQHFIDNTSAIFERIFVNMMVRGLLIADDPALLAFAYTAPITVIVHQCDREPEKEPEIMERLESFIRHFIKTYKA